jgi:hypothetical protein
MSAFKTCRVCPWQVTLFWLSLALMPAVLFAQNLAQTQTPSTRQPYLDLLNTSEATGDIYAPDLIEPLTVLGRLYREQGDFDQSAANLARARQILRINQGLSTLQEVFLIEELIRTEEARGDFAEVRALEQSLLTHAQIQGRDLQTFSLYQDLATKRLNLYQRYLTGERPPQIIAGCYYAKSIDLSAPQTALARILGPPLPGDRCTSGERKTVQRALLIEALAYQSLALNVLLHNDQHTSDEMLALMADIFHSSNKLNQMLGMYSDNYIGRVWRRALSKQAEDQESRVRRAQLQILFADLNLLRVQHSMRASRNDIAQLHDQYGRAYQSLVTEGVAQETLDALFTPGTPVVIPAFEANPFTSVEGMAQGDYIDAMLEIDERGRGKLLQITHQTEGVGRTDEKQFRNLVKASMFRPRMVEGKIARKTTVHIRYFVNSDDGESSGFLH